MTAEQGTYGLAAAQLGDYVQPLQHGALAMGFELRDGDGRVINLNDDFLAGQALLLLFVNCASEAADDALQALAQREAALASKNARALVIAADSNAARNRAVQATHAFASPVCGDSTGVVFASYGLHKLSDPALRWVLLTPYRQVRAWYDAPQAPNDCLDRVMTLLDDTLMTEAVTWSVPHAPVLIVPNVLSAAECATLIESFETRSPFTVRPPRAGEIDGNYRIPVYEHNRQDRVDEILKDKQTLEFLDGRLWSRVIPQIKKAFAFDISRREDLHIARYTGERGGNEMGHRDNVSAATAYRRFALSMNLNDNYDGGEVVFREFGDHGYKPQPGSAMIFSSSLLHEVLETTRGVRYTLISHLFNEQSAAPVR